MTSKKDRKLWRDASRRVRCPVGAVVLRGLAVKRPKLTAEGVLAAQPGLAKLNPGPMHATPRGPRPADALAACAAPGDRDVVAQVQRKRAARATRGRRAQHHGDVAESGIEAELDGGLEDAYLAWWRHFHPPFVRVAGSWRPRELRDDEGAVDYIVQPFECASVLLEAKSVDGGRFGLDMVPKHQRAHLVAHVLAGLPAALAVTFRTEGLRVVTPWRSAPWRVKRDAPAIYADDPAVIALATPPGDLVERLLTIARGGVR